jgi:glycosyltransferase involved in cell wall biosynthesis
VSDKSNVIPGLVSVVVCAYNNWPDVEMTIESALHQSYQPIEVIVVDNSSTDATPEEIPRRFGGAVQYIRQANRMDGGAYNAGFAVARGEFIQFADGDDVLAPNKIEKQVEIFRASPDLDIVYGDVRMFQTSAGPANWRDIATQPEDDILKAFIGHTGGQWPAINTLGSLLHRRALEKVGPFDESLYISDLDYWLRADYAGCRFGHCPGSPMGFSRMRPGQMTANRAAMENGREAVWQKALGYVTREPYRSLIAAKLARHRFYVAVARKYAARGDALAKLALARAASPEAISALAYAVGYVAVVMPGGAVLARARWLRAIRRILARLLRFRISQ